MGKSWSVKVSKQSSSFPALLQSPERLAENNYDSARSPPHPPPPRRRFLRLQSRQPQVGGREGVCRISGLALNRGAEGARERLPRLAEASLSLHLSLCPRGGVCSTSQLDSTKTLQPAAALSKNLLTHIICGTGFTREWKATKQPPHTFTGAQVFSLEKTLHVPQVSGIMSKLQINFLSLFLAQGETPLKNARSPSRTTTSFAAWQTLI